MKIMEHINTWQTKENTLYFVSVDTCYFFMTGYVTLGITGEPGNAMAVDPNGGPWIERGSDISQYTGAAAPQIVAQIMVTKNGVVFYTRNK